MVYKVIVCKNPFCNCHILKQFCFHLHYRRLRKATVSQKLLIIVFLIVGSHLEITRHREKKQELESHDINRKSCRISTYFLPLD